LSRSPARKTRLVAEAGRTIDDVDVSVFALHAAATIAKIAVIRVERVAFSRVAKGLGATDSVAIRGAALVGHGRATTGKSAGRQGTNIIGAGAGRLGRKGRNH
jgi:hypothetical protein